MGIRAKRAGESGAREFRLTRRALLGIGSGLAASPVVGALGAIDDEIHIVPTPTGFEVSYRNAVWTCETGWFGPNASNDLAGQIDIGPESGGRVLIHLSGISFPGTDLHFNLKVGLRFIEGRAAITFLLPAFRIDDVIDLGDWIAGLRWFAGRLSVKQAKTIATALENRSVFTIGKAILSMSPEGVFALDGDILLSVGGVSFPTRRIEFTANVEALPPGLSAPGFLSTKSYRIDGGYVAGATTVLWARPDAPEAGIFGVISSASAKLHDLSSIGENADGYTPPALSMVLADQSPTKSTCVVAKSVAFHGKLTFEATNAAASEYVEQWPSFRLQDALLQELVWGDHSRSWLNSQFDEKPTYVNSGHVPVTITGGEDRGLWAESVKKDLVAFSAVAEVNHAFVPMQGADFSRIDFESTALHYGLEGLLTEVHAQSTVAAGYMLGQPPVFSAVLGERAIVRVLRTADLFNLKYSFRDIYLLATPGEAVLDSCENCLPGFELAPGRAPLMIVRFPPQHIAEKAFLKVERNPEGDSAVKPRVPLGGHRLYETTAAPAGNGHLTTAAAKLKSNPGDALAITRQNLEAASKERDKDLSAPTPGPAAPPAGYGKLDDGDLIEALDHVVEARMAGPTRLVFTFEPAAQNAQRNPDKPVLPRRYALEDLANWRGLTAKVASRALPRDAPIVEQLRVAGLTYTVAIDQKTYLIDRNLSPPDAEATAIEFPYRLQLSPANDAIWHTPLPLTEDRLNRGVALWSARLDAEYGGRSVRALWSPDFEDARYGFFLEGRHPPHSNEQPWQHKLSRREQWFKRLGLPVRRPKLRMSLDARDRHELVLLSSVYGLPALLPVSPTDPAIAGEDALKRADSTVFPLPAGFTTALGQLGKEGVYAAQPLQHALVALSSLGATVNLHGQWEPPSGFTPNGAVDVRPLWPALTVERWHHEAFLGRDTFVEIVYKGFLFPLGHRCSVIKATERKFIADPFDRSGRAPVAYLVQRYFVVIGEPTKPFPAVGQRYNGRALYSNSITMVTTVTPDIIDPFENPLLKDTSAGLGFGSAGGAAFFPKSLPGPGLEGAVQFEYEVEYSDGEKRLFKGPLVVVDNTLAHDPKGIEELVAFYNTSLNTRPELGDRARTADAKAQRVRYAEDNKAGSTEFVTRDWLLGAHGRDVENVELQFTMDAVMEGADQPPFYPVCAEARVEVQSLNYMNGKSQGYTPAGYDLHYLQHGFSPKNPSGIFLALLDRGDARADLTLDSNTQTSGGIATPNMKSVALSREKGPVGGKKATSNLADALATLPVASKRTLASGPVVADERGRETEIELSFAQQGQFDALEAFMGALKLPKLFGIIPLESIIPILSFIDGAPEAIESTTHKITEQLDEFAREAELIIASVRSALNGAIGTIDARLAEYSAELQLPQPLQFNDLYPRLEGSFIQLEKSLLGLERSAASFNPTEPERVFGALRDTASAVKVTLAEVKAVARHPKPAIVDSFVKQINVALHATGDALRDAVRAELKALRDEMEEYLVLRLKFERGVDDSADSLEQMADQITLVSVWPPEFETTGALPLRSGPEGIRLYQFLVGALTGRPDSWAPVYENTGPKGTPRIVRYEHEVAFDLKNFRLRKQNVEQAADDALNDLIDEAADQLLEQALLNDTVTKPLIDAYFVVSNLVAAFEKDIGDFERQLHELPHQLTLVVASWLEGILGLQRLFALAKQFEAKAAEHLKAALGKYVDPLIKNLPEVKADSERVDQYLLQLVTAIDNLQAVAIIPPTTKSDLSQARVRLAQLRVRFDAALDDYEALRVQLKTPLPSQRINLLTIDPDELAKLQAQLSGGLGKLYASQSAALTALSDTIDASLDVLEITGSEAHWAATKVAAEAIEKASLELIRLIVTSPTFVSGVQPFETILGDFDASLRAELDKAATDLVDRATDIVFEVGVAVAAEALAGGRAFLDKAGVWLAEYGVLERRLTGLATRGLLIGAEALDKADTYLFARLKPVLGKALRLLSSDKRPEDLAVPVTAIYDAAVLARAALKPDSFLSPDEIAILKLFLDQKLFAIFEDTTIDIDLAGERTTIIDAAAMVESGAKFSDLFIAGAMDGGPVNTLVGLVRSWSHTTPTPARVMEPIQQLADLLINGKLSDLIDFGPLEEALKSALLRFIPNQISFDYDWGVPLKPFPSGSSKIFWIDQKRKALNQPGKPFAPSVFKDKDRDPNNDLTIYVRAGVDLADPTNPKPLLQAEGDIRYANIKLFGPSFDVVTVRFDQISFKADRSGSNFDVSLASDPVAFGKMVRFIESLSKIFGDSGPYIYPAINPFGVVVGYRYQAPPEGISIGTIALLDFSIDIAARLSFDNTPISFRFALASREKSLKILCTPYGGAGYLALTTVASDIVSFELQLEFGAAVTISFPPLSAYGFVSAGIYIEKRKGQDLILEGFVRAVGEGNIVCFTIAVFFEVRVRQVGSNVTGSLTVKVSFKVGFAKISYSYTAAYQFAGGSGGGRSQRELAKREPDSSSDTIEVVVPNRVKDWGGYRKFFAARAA